MSTVMEVEFKTVTGSPPPRLQRYAGLFASRFVRLVLRSAVARSRKAGVGIEPAYTDLRSDDAICESITYQLV